MDKDNEIVQSLIAGGLIGASLGALLSSKNKGEGAALGALAGAAILATYKANELALKGNVPVLIEENGYLYEIHPDGSKNEIRKLEKPSTRLPKQFNLS